MTRVPSSAVAYENRTLDLDSPVGAPRDTGANDVPPATTRYRAVGSAPDGRPPSASVPVPPSSAAPATLRAAPPAPSVNYGEANHREAEERLPDPDPDDTASEETSPNGSTRPSPRPR